MKDMSTILNKKLSTKQFYISELVVIVSLAVIPLFVDLPYRINIFLAWEGAYRLYLGQIPYKDFGLPLGFGFWIIPAVFFKIFGPYLITLVKAQVLVNILAGITFSNILKSLKVIPAHKFVAVTVFAISYSFVNFWPWYNHMVFFYQLLSINFLLIVLVNKPQKALYFIYIFLSTLFLFLSVFTKQDGGALAFAINSFLILYYAAVNKTIRFPLIYGGSLLFIALLFVVPLSFYEFDYWYNHGQPPHSSRIYLMDFLQDIFGHSSWIKFYLLLIVLLVISQIKYLKDFIYNQQKVLFFLLSLGILVQAILVQVTSYIPHNVNIYFHSFAIAFILANVDIRGRLNYPHFIVPVFFLILFWWSSDYWVYGQRIITRVAPELLQKNTENVISKNTWMISQDTAKISRDDWTTIDLPSFNRILMPQSTVEGIGRLKELAIWKNNPKVLNMTELTPLAYEFGFEPEKGSNIPLWYHKGVSLFNREVEMYCDKISTNYYDIILFETIPYLNNFYPEEVRQCIKAHYKQIDIFLAPRHIQNSYIEVYIRKETKAKTER